MIIKDAKRGGDNKIILACNLIGVTDIIFVNN